MDEVFKRSTGDRISARWARLVKRAKPPPAPDVVDSKDNLADDLCFGNYDTWTPEACIQILKTPTVENFAGLKKLLYRSDAAWMQEFLERQGLEALFESLPRLSQKTTTLKGALILINCVECLRAVMNCPTGLDHIVQRHQYTRKILEAFASNNVLVKKQVVELLSAVCLYSPKGHLLTMDALEHYTKSRNVSSRLGYLVEELKLTECEAYVVAVLAFINCIILTAEGTLHKARIRNEFIAQGLLEAIKTLAQSSDNEEIFVQIKAFEDDRAHDEELVLSEVRRSLGLEIIEHFATVMEKISSTPHAVLCLDLTLRNLSKVDPGRPESNIVWDLLERISATLSEKHTSEPNVLMNLHYKLIDVIGTDSWKMPNSSNEKNELSSTGDGQLTVTREDCSESGARCAVVRSTDGAAALKKQNIFRHLSQRASQKIMNISLRRKPKERNDTLQVEKSGQSMTPNSTRSAASSGSVTPTFPPPRADQISPSTFLECSARREVTAKPSRDPHKSSAVDALSLPSSSNCLECSNGNPGSPTPTNGFATPPPSQLLLNAAPSPPPPPPPMPTNRFAIPPPPPPPMPSNASMPSQESTNGFAPPPPPPMPMNASLPPPSPAFPFLRGGRAIGSQDQDMISLSVQPQFGSPAPQARPVFFATLPRPSSKMKTFNWLKVPETTVMSRKNIWKEIMNTNNTVEGKLDFNRLEELFCQKQPKTDNAKSESTKKKTKAPSKVNLLDNKRSMNVNIALRQFKQDPNDLVDMLRKCQGSQFGVEKLKMLKKSLPSSDEIALLKSYKGDVEKLGDAERFFLALISLKQYNLYVDGLLLIEEFEPAVNSLLPSLKRYDRICRTILTSKALQGFLGLTLFAGNFINSDSYAGNASGFQLSTLSRLLETRANQPRVTLLHYLVDQAETKMPEVLKFFLHELDGIETAAKFSLETAKSDIEGLRRNLRKLENGVQNAESPFKEHLQSFLEVASPQIDELDSEILTITDLSKSIVDHFCEDERFFNIEECIRLFATFCAKVKEAIRENKERKSMEEKLVRLRKAREEASKNASKRIKVFVESETNCALENLLAEVRRGDFKLRG